MTPHETTIYLAGLFDGEGYISFTSPEPIHTYVYAGIGMVSDKALQLANETFPGGHLKLRQNSAEKNWQDSWYWHIYGPSCKEFLKAVHPYLLIKQTQAELAIEFLSLAKGRGRKYTDSENLHRMLLVGELSKLNVRGRREVEANT